MVEPFGGNWLEPGSSESLNHEIPEWGLTIGTRHCLCGKIPSWTSKLIDTQCVVGVDEILIDKSPHILSLDIAWLYKGELVRVLSELGSLCSHGSEQLDVTDGHSHDIDLLSSLSINVLNLSLGVK